MNRKKQIDKSEKKEYQIPEPLSFMVCEPQVEYQVQTSNFQKNEEETYSLEEFKNRFEEKLEKRLGVKISL